MGCAYYAGLAKAQYVKGNSRSEHPGVTELYMVDATN